MAKTETYPCDPAEYLRDDVDMAAYLEAALEDGDPAFVAHVLGVIARAKGMSHLARETGLGRESLYIGRRGEPRFCHVVEGHAGAGLHAGTA